MSLSLSKTNLKYLYEADNHLWLEETIKLLKDNHLDQLDIEHLIEELESLARRDKNKASSLLEQIIRHLLYLNFPCTNLLLILESLIYQAIQRLALDTVPM